MESQTLQTLRLGKLAQQVIPITAQLDKRQAYSLTEVVLPPKPQRMWRLLESSSSEDDSDGFDTMRKRPAAPGAGATPTEASSKKVPVEILPPPSALSASVDLGRVARRTQELAAFEMQMPHSLQEEFRKRVNERVLRERKRLERRCRRQLRQFNRRGVFDKDINSSRIKTLLHVEYSRRADPKLIETEILSQMLEEYKWKRAHAGEELDDIETKLDTVFQGTRFQSVTKEGKKTLMEKSDLIPQVLAGFARRARKKVVEQAASPSHVDISSGQHLPVRMAKVRARTPALTPLKHAHATLKHSTVVDVVQGDHPLLDSSASPPRHSPIASLTLTGPASSQQRAKVGDDAVSDGDASDMGSPKGLTREDMRVTGAGVNIGPPTINPATRSQPVFIQYLQGITAEVQEEARNWAVRSGALPDTPAVTASLPRPAVLPSERHKVMDASVTQHGARGSETIHGRIPEEPDEFESVLISDTTGLIAAPAKASSKDQDRMLGQRKGDMLSFKEYRTSVLRRPTIQEDIQAKLRELNQSFPSIKSSKDTGSNFFDSRVKASHSLGIADSLRTQALGKVSNVDILPHRAPSMISLDVPAPARSLSTLPISASAPTLAAAVSDASADALAAPSIPAVTDSRTVLASPRDPQAPRDDLQDLMFSVWNQAEMPTTQRLDFLLKYSQPAFAASLGVALRTWQRALAAVSVCERVKHSIRRLRKLTSDHLSSPLKPAGHLLIPMLSESDAAFLQGIGCFVELDSDTSTHDSLRSSAVQHEAVFEALRSYICVVCEELYTRYEDVLTYRGQDYAAMLSSTNAAVAMIESAEPIMRQVANLL